MNIFYLHDDPVICAKYHSDKHVVKMILETTQLLYTCLWITLDNNWQDVAPLTKTGKRGYKQTHKNHPSAIWVRESIQNYHWLCDLGIALCTEYTYRYNKIHACYEHLQWLKDQKPNIPNIEKTQIKLAMPQPYKTKCPISSYREYYIHEKRTICRWTRREIPEWFKNGLITHSLV